MASSAKMSASNGSETSLRRLAAPASLLAENALATGRSVLRVTEVVRVHF
jgi:hypothetical protein